TTARIDTAINETRVAQGKAQMLVASTFTAGALTSNLALAVVIVVGTRIGMGGGLTAGQVVAFLFLVQLFTGPVQLATEILNELQNALAGWRRVIAIMETPIDVSEPAHPVTVPVGRDRAGQITFRNLYFAYPGGPDVLRDVNLALPPQRRIAIVGQTGSGKTTLAKLACRLMDPTRGEVLLDGVDLRRFALADLRRLIVLVPQEGFLFEGTIADNIAYAARTPLSPEQITAAFRNLGLGDWLAELPNGIETQVGERGESLSAGERQLVALARASIAQSEVLVLDEATSAVDPATEVRIARALELLSAGKTTITIAHRISTAEAADLVVVVDNGRVIEVGTAPELIAAGGEFAQMHRAWQSQIASEIAGG
ncbi:MAG: ABC transporter ATP-binding protein/permease, partial [Promicromonosporaceae bacterium]|nr:ABC transporter ATP-binding protein/permease [Promicromonosporaceae bacterium]